MRRSRIRETAGDRAGLVADAGLGPISLISALAGVLVAYGAFVVLGGIVGAVVTSMGLDVEVTSTDYERLGILGGLIAAGVLFLSYLFGGYVAGRMARRRGFLHGALVLLLGILLVTAVAALTSAASESTSVTEALRSFGIPTTADEYGNALTVAGLAALAAIVLGSLLGGAMGEQWHGQLIKRAVDPNVGTEAEARERAQREAARAEAERTRSFERVRRANPRRAAREDRVALSDEERRIFEGGAVTGEGRAVLDRSEPERPGTTSRRHDQEHRP